MSRRLAGAALAALLAAAAGAQVAASPPAAPGTPSGAGASAPPPPAAPPALAERLAWTPWERTRAGIGRLEKGDAPGAARDFDTAYRLRADDPRAAYNAGTGRLAAGQGDAAPPLEQATRSADSGLAADAFYNLGNARLAAGDERGAIASYVESLRRASGRQDAKRNLEIALRRLAQQQREQQRRQAGSEKREQRTSSGAPEGEPSSAGAQEQPGRSGQETRPQNADRSDSRQDAASGEQPRAGQQSAPARADGSATTSRDGRLPDFTNQPDLDAAQAAALLQAVENLERQQRRERALERARQRHSEGQDW